MSKYDFGKEIKQGSTMEWAIKHICTSSKVLELGSAVGTLTKHLKEDKNCIVDIVELDEEAGKQAAVFARKSYIGTEKGNIETYYWYTELQKEEYDYIVVLDVIEHLHNPQKLLKCISGLLGSEGVLLLSVPNIAHNSILIDLYNNKFNYSNLGLLDNTHIHFYSYNGLCKELSEAELFPFSKEAIQLRVGENEIINSYKDVPQEMETALRTRMFGDVYQFLFQVRKKKESDVEELMQLENLPYTLYEMCIYNSMKELVLKKYINPEKSINIEIEEEFIEGELIISLLNTNCIIRNLEISAECNGHDIIIPIEKTNAILIENLNVFIASDSQIVLKLTKKISKIKIRGDILVYGTKSLEYVKPFWKMILEQNQKLDSLQEYKNKLFFEQGKYSRLVEECDKKEVKIYQLYDELQECRDRLLFEQGKNSALIEERDRKEVI